MNDPLQTPPDPIECPWCHSKYAPRLYGWHERTEDGRNVNTRYTVRCLNCGAQGPKKEIGPHAIDAWNNRKKAATPVGAIAHCLLWIDNAMGVTGMASDPDLAADVAKVKAWLHERH